MSYQKVQILLGAVIFLLFSNESLPQAGELDATFGQGGIVTTAINIISKDNTANSVGIQSDGKIVAAGVTHYIGDHDFALVRCLPNGELDASFGINGVVVTHIGDSEDNANALVIQNDGKIVVAGGSYNINDNFFDLAIVRYNTDGSLDSTFGSNGMVVTQVSNYSAYVNSIEIQNDGKIVVAGDVYRNSDYDFVTARYNTDGTLDNTFGGDGIVITQVGSSSDFARSLKIQNDGKIVVAGYSYSDGNNYDFALVRYHPDGGLDNTFGQGGKVTAFIGTNSDLIYSIAIQDDGKIVAAGSSYNGVNNDIALARYNSDGAIDNTFGINGIVITQIGSSTDDARSLTIWDDKIIVAGYSANDSNNDFAIVRYNIDGELDNTFGTNGIVVTQIGTSNDVAFSSKILVDGKLIVAGSSQNDDGINDFAIVRYNPNGELDNTFGNFGIAITPIGISRSEIRSIAIQGDGKIVSGGYFNNKPNTSPDYDFALARYNPDGKLDNGFGTNGIVTTMVGPTQDYGYSVAIQNDGRIVTGGYSWNGSDYDFALARYSPDGELDITFGTNGKVTTPIGMGNDWAYSIAIQYDGKIIAAGGSHNGTDQDVALARYNTDGTLDNTFGTNGIVITPVGPSHDYANSLTLQEDGKIVVGGNVALVRYNTDGSLDNTFGEGGVVITPIGNGQVNSVVIQEDGKIVAAGYSVNEGSDFTVGRYNTDGSLDDTFGTDGIVVTPIGISTDIAYSAAIQSDGKIIAAGYSLNQGDYELAIVRYNPNGELDNTFGTDGIITKRVGSSDAIAYSIAIQEDGNIIVGGNSEDGEDYSVFLIVRYTGDPATGISEETRKEIPTNYELVQNYPNPFNPVTKIQYSVPQSSMVSIKVYDVLGKEIETLIKEEKPAGVYELNWNAATLPSGVYFYRLQAGSFIESKKMILLK